MYTLKEVTKFILGFIGLALVFIGILLLMPRLIVVVS